MIRPLVDGSILMKYEGNNVAHVMLAYLNIYRHTTKFCNGPDVEDMLELLKKRCENQERHLFFLALPLHLALPAVKILDESEEQNGSWNVARNSLSRGSIKKGAKLYS